jgi:UDP-glucose 4-epimerase
MNVLITGATGYIGGALVQYLDAETNHEITVHCRNLPPHFESWRDRFSVVEADIRDENKLSESLNSDIKAIIHLAAFNNVDTEESSKESLVVNGYGTRTILKLAEIFDVENVIYFSTQKVYGTNLEGTYSVASPLDCQDDYAVTHAVAERYCQMFASSRDLTVNVVRPSNVFGAPVNSVIDLYTLL